MLGKLLLNRLHTIAIVTLLWVTVSPANAHFIKVMQSRNLINLHEIRFDRLINQNIPIARVQIGPKIQSKIF